jgi:hypothetical protein
MTECVVRKDSAFFDGLEQRQHEIARNAEDFAGAVSFQAVQQRCGQREHWSLGVVGFLSI